MKNLFASVRFPRTKLGKNASKSASNARREKSSRRTLRNLIAEKLHARFALAGDVTAVIDSGYLVLRGDDAANDVKVERVSGNQVRISGQNNTKINGLDQPALLRVRKGFDLQMKGGDDKLSVIGLNAVGRYEIRMDLGAGNDTLSASSLSAQRIHVLGGAGNDTISVTNSRSRRGSGVGGDAGDDSMTLSNLRFGNGSCIDGGTGKNTLTETNTRYGVRSTHLNLDPNAPSELVNIPPVANNDSASVVIGSNIPISVLANDTDSDGTIDATSVTIVAQPSSGTLSVNSTTGVVTYTHTGTAAGSDTFRYKVKDNRGAFSNEATVTLTVTSTPKAPTATADSFSVPKSGSTTFNLSTNDITGTAAINTGSIVISTQPTNGTVTVGTNGNVTYQHNGSNTTSDTFAYTIKDINGLTSTPASVQVTVTATPTPPTATADSFSVVRNGSTTANLATNDIAGTAAINAGSIVISTQPTNGTVTVGTNGNITYQHNGSNTTTDTFAYTIKDINGLTSTPASVQVTVTATPTPPTATADSFSVVRNGSTTANLATNDIAGSAAINAGSIVISTQPTNGTVTVGTNGNITYQHNGSNTTSDTFAYTIKDINGLTSNPVSVQVTVTAAPTPPTATADSMTVSNNGSSTVNLASNDVAGSASINPNSIVITSQPANGTITVGTNGNATYQHNGTNTTTDSFAYTIKDINGLTSAAASVQVTISAAAPQAPTAVNDTGSVTEGASVTLSILSNDIPPTGGLDPASIVFVDLPTNGTIVKNANGTVSYSHTGNENTSDVFRYTVKGTNGIVSNEATVSITIVPVNDAPVANNDTAVGLFQGIANIPILSNDTDVDGNIDVASVTIVSQPQHGTLQINNLNGEVTYTHTGATNASDSFTYRVKDTLGLLSNIATVSITIQTPPNAQNDQLVVTKAGTTTIDVTANDTAPSGTLNKQSIVIRTQPVYGTLTLLGDGQIRYSHDGTNSTSDQFSYTIADSNTLLSNTATVSVSIQSPNVGPTANNDQATVAEGGTVNIPVLVNDTDPDNSIDTASVLIVNTPTHGTATLGVGGVVIYTHDGSNTTVDSFTYRVSDVSGSPSGLATVSIAITPTNDPPVAQNDSAIVQSGTPKIINLAANDSGSDDGLDLTSIEIVSQPSQGTLSVNNNGTVTYEHNGSTNLQDSFTYRIRDIAGAQSNIATVQLTIERTALPPLTAPDSATVDEGGTVNINVLANDTARDNPINAASVTVVTSPINGTVTVNSSGVIQYIHNGSETTADSFTYRVSDTAGLTSATTTVSLVVVPVNEPPVAVNDSKSIASNIQAIIDLAANDFDVDDGLDLSGIVIGTAPVRGTLTIHNDGTVTYVHDGSESVQDTFTYRIKDKSGALSNEATVSLSIELINQPPIANPDSATMSTPGGQIVIDLAANDSDPDGGLNLGSIVIKTPPTNGSVSVIGDGTIRYTHNGGSSTTDSFTYQIRDFAGLLSNEASVSINVVPF